MKATVHGHIQPDPNQPDPTPPAGANTVTWAYVGYLFVHNIPIYLTLLTSLATAVLGYQNHRRVEAVETQIQDTRNSQEYHGKQLDSIGEKIDKTKKEIDKKHGAFD